MLAVIKRIVKDILANAKRFRRVGKCTPKKLHLGCGQVHIEEYCNVDITPLPSVDIVDNVATLKKFKKNSIEQIYACHVLEHFDHEEVKVVLNRWFDVLKPGGEIRISVPDIDRIVTIYKSNWEHFQTKGHSPWIGLIFGGQADAYDYHKTGFNFCWLSHMMENIGYAEMCEYPHEPHFIPGVKDASLAHEPFAEYLSLNIKAVKPA
ncbi:methyltransferase domain-containing protein [Thermodesulfobacteriota bacterium]